MATTTDKLVIKILADNKQALKDFKQVSKSLKTIGKTATKVGKSLSLKLTAPLLLLGGVMAKAAIEFETAFTGVRKTVDATEKQFAALEKGLKSMALEIPLSTEELFGLGEAAGQLGIKQKDILGFTKVMADLGATTNLAANEAATSLARFANITRLAADDYDKLGSTIVELGNNLATTEREIVEMSMRLAGAGTIAGMTQAQILSLAGALTSVGVRAEAGGTSFSRVMKEIGKSVGTGNEAMKLFASVSGQTVAEFEKRWKEDAANALIDFTEGLAKAQAAGENINIVLDELGLGGIRISDSLLRAAGSGDLFREALKLGSKAWKENTALTKEANLRYKTAASQLKIARNQVAQLAESFGVVLVPAILNVTNALKPVVTWLKNLDESTKTVLVVIGGLTAAIGPALIALGLMVNGIKALHVISTITPLVTGLAGAFGLLLGYAVGTWAADWIFGLDKIKAEMRAVAKEQVVLEKRLSKKLITLGFGDIDEFNKAVKSGLVIYNKALGIWEKTAEVIKKANEERIKAEEKAAETTKRVSEAQQEAIDKTVKALTTYINTIDTLGDKYLDIAKTRFADELKIEGTKVIDLNASMQRYKAIIEETFSSRHNLHQALIAELDFQKAKEVELMAAEMAAAQSQLDMNEKLLASYRTYYDALKALRDKSVKEQIKKIKELAKFEENILKQSKTFVELIKGLELKITPDPRNEVEKFYAKQIELEEKLSTIQDLSGKKKLDALQAFAIEAAAQAKEVTGVKFGIETTISLKEASEAALELVREAQAAFEAEAETIKAAKQAEIQAAKEFQAELKTSMDAALADIYFFENEILSIAQAIEQLEVTVSLNDLATEGIQAIQAELDALQDKTLTITTRYLTETASGSSGGTLGGLATGTPYVPQTGPYFLHQGEAVIPANENRKSNDNRQDNSHTEYHAHYYGDQQGSRVEQEFEMQQMFQNMQRYDASLTQ